MGNVIPRNFRLILAKTLADSSVFKANTRVIITKDDHGYLVKGPEGVRARAFPAHLRNENLYEFHYVVR